MSIKKILTFYGLKWNPFSEDIPVEAIHKTASLSRFCFSVENIISSGGFALLTGSSGTGKSVTLRALEARLMEIREITVGVITRPQSNLYDFYRELGYIFSHRCT